MQQMARIMWAILQNQLIMNKTTKITSIVAVAIVVAIFLTSFSFLEKISPPSPSMSTSAVTLKTNMRKLWEDHVTWTRNVIFCIMDDLPGTDQAVTRLLKNQDDIGDAIKPVYGDEAGNKLAALLHTHITQAADLLKAAKKGDQTAQDAVTKKWFENADEISEFLSKANPNWKLEDMKEMMHDHLKLTTNEAVARLKKDYPGDVVAYDKVHDEILKMSDMLTDGIIKQYPDKFK